MKQIITLCCACALAMCAISCAELEEAGPPAQGQGHVSITGTADVYTSLAATRTQVGDMADDGALAIDWSVGDTIGVFGATTQNAAFISGNTEPAATTTFSGDLADGDTPLYAYYPYDSSVTDMAAIPVTIPAEQMYEDESSVALYDVKAANVLTDEGSGQFRVRMRQMAALVRFEIDLTGVSDLADDELLMDITIHPVNQGVPMTGDFTYNLADLDAGLTPGNATADGLTLYFMYPPTAREKITAYAVVAPGQHEGEEWQCVFTTDRQQGEFTTTALCDFEAGKFYTVPLTVTVLDNNEATYVDLPEEETANCYIVTETGEHDFKATVIGNGAKGIIADAGFHTDTPYINPKSAKVLWSTGSVANSFVSDVRLVNGRVLYRTNQTTGNAVIAVYSEPDCQGDILWSWHIWGTTGMPEDEEYTNQAGATFMVMDRDLGALSVGDNRGVVYQWGRKDPFLAYYSGVAYVADGTRTSASRWPLTAMDGGATITDAIRNPMQMIWTGNSDNCGWLGKPNLYLWGDYGRDLPDDLGDSRCGAGWNSKKTIYDPSPVGYRVANIFTFSGFTDMPSGNTGDVEDVDNGFPVPLDRLDHINYVEDATSENRWYFMKNADDTEGTCYREIETRDGSTGRSKNNSTGGYWWAAEAFVTESGVQACYLKTDDYKESVPVASSTAGNRIETYAKTADLRDANGIRCVREE